MPATSIVYLKFKNHIADPLFVLLMMKQGRHFKCVIILDLSNFALKLRFYSMYSFQLLFTASVP